MMSLRGIHLLFITVSIALTAMASGLGMGIYLVTFIRKTRRIGME